MDLKEQLEDARFTHPIRTRVTAKTYKRLEQIMQNSNCRSMGEVTRKILSQEKILMLKRDVSMNGTMEELTLIRKELKSIGININQQTRHFHTQRMNLSRRFILVEHSRHKSSTNFISNMIAGLIAYLFLPEKPSIN